MIAPFADPPENVSGGFADCTGAETAGAYPNLPGIAAGCCHSYFLKVGQPATTGLVMGVRNIISGGRFFPADFTYFGHNILLYR